MIKPTYGILRFAKYKGPEISRIEAHNERTKEKYASNPDINTAKSKLNYHLVEPQRKYRAEAEKQISEANCRTRKDSVRVIETLITATPEFFQGKSPAQVQGYFQSALEFMQSHLTEGTIISAVVHLDEKTPHMHLSFVPITQDGRLSAKDILGNRKKLVWWQDEFWTHMVKQYPELERGASASQTGRDHIPPRLFKEMAHLTKQKAKIDQLLTGANLFNSKGRMEELGKLLQEYVPSVERMTSELKKRNTAFTMTVQENKQLKQSNAALKQELKDAQQTSLNKRLKEKQLQLDYQAAVETLNRIPDEVVKHYTAGKNRRKDHTIG